MPTRKIAVCCDGTWNDPGSGTNIRKTFELLGACLHDARTETLGDDREVARGRAPSGEECLLYYDRGVGTGRRQRGKGGVFGIGLGENVRQAYAFLAEHATVEDEIHVFGFSRGAFTVRSLCGLLGCAGLPTRLKEQAVEAAWNWYRLSPAERSRPPAERREAVERMQADLLRHEPRGVKVRFLGIYDTVGSLGIPVPRLRWLNGWADRLMGGVIRFHDTTLGRNVEIACQALAIHERRGTFKPVVWSRAPGRVRRADGTVVEQRVLQTWFAGAHADVGGGYLESDLADIAFIWMMNQAAEAGLHVDPERLLLAAPGNCYGFRHDSDRSLIARVTSGETLRTVRALAGRLPPGLGMITWVLDLFSFLQVPACDRQIAGEIETDDGTFCVPVGERIHESVLARYRGEMQPESVRKALACGIEVFRERAERRRPLADGEPAAVNDDRCTLLDVSPSGVRIRVAAQLDPKAQHRFESRRTGSCTAELVWQQGDRAGLRLLQTCRRPAPSPPPAGRRQGSPVDRSRFRSRASAPA